VEVHADGTVTISSTHSTSTYDFHARMRAEIDGVVVLDEAFVGYAGSENVPDRFRAEAAVQVMYEAMRLATSVERQSTAGDRELVAARCRSIDKDSRWVVDRLRGMAEALRER
jgi:hypothetical protein